LPFSGGLYQQTSKRRITFSHEIVINKLREFEFEKTDFLVWEWFRNRKSKYDKIDFLKMSY
jgi:hypothetical protein